MRTIALFLLLALGGCLAGPPAQRRAPPPDPAMARVIATAADQVKRCYRAPRVGRSGRGIVTVLRVAFAPDGTLAELPALVVQRGITEENRPAAVAFAEAAALAVVRCAPLRLPPEQYRGGWDSFELTFSPKAVA